ncbi:hypothetical protein KFK09_002609 [Dendrobium nobile]|uniref:histone deacetylase n=1 Tax=Dendrobium nobile TaxID=94219 RepID=A0A8T3C7Q8_DENNO|nr:hypothetical protein KFK09_002609 [Dendrobium nobile]
MGATLLYENKILEEKVSDDVATTRGSLTIKVAAMSNDADNGCLGVSGAVQFEHNGEHRGNTLCDLHHQENYGDDEYDEEDDSDWEPVNHLVFKKWFCSNCTMPNFDDVYHCDVCGEQKESEIFSHELFKHSFGDGNWNSINTESLQMFQGIFPGKCTLIPAREIQLEELQKVNYFTPDTYTNQHSALAARLAAGLCADLAIFIMSGKTSNGFALVRPPGHHAGIRQAMGFCLHNNAAVAALAAQTAGANKVLIVDWDVHHGNGTQEIFDGNKSVLYVSLHRHENGRFYPGTGAANEVGVMDGKGYSVNIPWSRGGVGDNDYIFAFQHIVLPVTPAGYAMMTHMLSSLSQGKLLVILEGGYNLRSISSSATAVVKVLLGEIPRYDMSDVKPSKAGLETVLQVLKIQMKFWPILGTKFEALRAEWKLVASNRRKFGKRRFFLGPIWWRWGTKRFVYELLYGHRKMRRHSKRFLL